MCVPIISHWNDKNTTVKISQTKTKKYRKNKSDLVFLAHDAHKTNARM